MSKKNNEDLTQEELMQKIEQGLLGLEATLADLSKPRPPIQEQLSPRTIHYLLTTPLYAIDAQYNLRVAQLVRALMFIQEKGLAKDYSAYLKTLN